MDTARLQELFTQFKSEQPQVKNRDSRVLIIDGLNLFIRAFSSSPVMNRRGDHIGGLVGFVRSLFSLIRMFRPTRCILVFDGEGGSKRRRELFPEYKSGRKNRDSLNRYIEVDGVINESDSLESQFSRLEKYIQTMPLTTLSVNNIEADDTIAYIVNNFYGRNDYGNIIIASSDRDFLQLVDERIQVYSPTKKILYDIQTVCGEFGFTHKNYLLYRVLTGDTSDNIPGIRGMGLKTMLKYFPEMISDTLGADDVLSLAEQKIAGGSKAKIYSTLTSSKSQLYLNWELMQLGTVDIPSSKMIEINKLMSEGIYHLNKSALKQLMYDDGVLDHFTYVDSALFSMLTQLDVYAES